jgi:hypothetical protein
VTFIQHGLYGNKKIQGDLYVYGAKRITSDYFLKLTTGSGAVVSVASGIVPSATRKIIKILIGSTAYKLLAATDWVDANSSSASPSRSPSASRSPSSSASKSPSPSHV